MNYPLVNVVSPYTEKDFIVVLSKKDQTKLYLGAIQVLRNAVGGEGCRLSRKKAKVYGTTLLAL